MVNTSAPISLAIWISSSPTPPAPAWIRHLVARRQLEGVLHEVVGGHPLQRHGGGDLQRHVRPAPSSRSCAGTTTCSAYEPGAARPRHPVADCDTGTSAPTASTVPAPSRPERVRQRHLVQARAVVGVDVVETGGGDLDEQVAGARASGRAARATPSPRARLARRSGWPTCRAHRRAQKYSRKTESPGPPGALHGRTATPPHDPDKEHPMYPTNTTTRSDRRSRLTLAGGRPARSRRSRGRLRHRPRPTTATPRSSLLLRRARCQTPSACQTPPSPAPPSTTTTPASDPGTPDTDEDCA